MLLSIGMIVKNEEKYLEQCLTSLKPILENVDSELIIADTGSTDNTVEIAKKFTDKVYYFEWINDFAAARNFTMEKAAGEWFMFLDADEIFDSCDEIIHFFNSGEYKSYGNASYKIHSFIDESDLSRFTESVAVRFAKRFPDVAFRNRIHEGFFPLHKPIKTLNTYANHYGYFYKNAGQVTETAHIKSKRNLELLFESINNPPFDYSVYREIADCYCVINDFENTLKYINIGLEKLDHRFIGITQYYNYKAIYSLRDNKFDDLINTCNEYFNEQNTFRKKPIATDVDMYAWLGEGYFKVNEFEKAVNCFINFFKVYKDFKNGRLQTEDMLYNPIKTDINIVKNIYAMFLQACINLKKFAIATEYLKGFPVEEVQTDRPYMLLHFNVRAKIMENTGWKNSKKFFTALDFSNKKMFFSILHKKMLSTDKREELFRTLSEFVGSIPEAEGVIGIYRSLFNDELMYEQIEDHLKKYGSYGNADILTIMLTRGMDISCFIRTEDFNAQASAHDFYVEFSDNASLMEEYDVDLFSPDVLVKAASFYGWAMIEAINSGKDMAVLFEVFGNISVKWYSENPNALSVPGDIRAGEIVHIITEARKRNDYQTCIAEMRRLIKVCPSAAPFVSEYRKVIEQEIAPKKDVRSELAEMAEAVKKNIRSMIEAGDISSAENTLLELEKLCPADAEIGILKYDIKMHKNR